MNTDLIWGTLTMYYEDAYYVQKIRIFIFGFAINPFTVCLWGNKTAELINFWFEIVLMD